ncbi:magnesium/cobalt transporter CorA [Acetobacter estunensis NRIC 0472]|uniref:Magnesium transporter n=1 Tax=Acetobacter estunensis TaxID=104097 RepID=A0A967EE31_9PROT|nr:CorA family divalent cation transporter [Acetobacter estunensis]NHO54921.1 magnesium transporter [Acetobacter estunensis]GBQ27638.1 magnesium/cobalt transporter CorA [Acetobacter estunensis NRIC 0472]
MNDIRPPFPDPDNALADGLVWAIRLLPGEPPEKLESDEIVRALAGDPPAKGGWVWLHFDIVHTRSRAQVEAIPCLTEDAQQTLTNTDKGARLEAEGDLVYGALPAFDDAASEDDRDVCIWRFAMLPTLLVTTRRHPIPALGVVYREIQRRQVPDNPAGLVDRALLEFADTARRTMSRLDDQLDRAEDVLLLLDRDTDLGRMGGMLGQVRRRSTELRRVISPVNRIFQDEELELPEWAEDDLRDRSERQIHGALDDLLALQDRARSLQDELTSNQAEETNRRLYIVSVGTTMMLPATFVTGFFGMNTGGMFLAAGQWGTIEAGGLCFLIMVGTWFLLKMTKLL